MKWTNEENWKQLLLSGVFFLGICLGGVTPLYAGTDLSDYDAITVYTQQDDGRYSVFLSTQKDGEWQDPIVISNNDKLNVVPTVAVSDKGVIWVVWGVFSKGDIALHMKRYNNGEWSNEEVIETGMDSNTAPSIIFDGNDVLWLVWAGGDGQDDDIYYSRWNGSAFESPARITDNEVPDIQPVLGLTDTGTIWVQWQMAGDDNYETQSAYWDAENEKWTADPVTEEQTTTRLQKAMTVSSAEDEAVEEESEVDLPDFIDLPKTASVHIPGKKVQSIPFRLVEKNDEQATDDELTESDEDKKTVDEDESTTDESQATADDSTTEAEEQ